MCETKWTAWSTMPMKACQRKKSFPTSRHRRRLHGRCCAAIPAVALAALLFILSLIHVPGSSVLKAAAYFLGALAYLGEIVILTDWFSQRVPHREMFMAYCFGRSTCCWV